MRKKIIYLTSQGTCMQRQFLSPCVCFPVIKGRLQKALAESSLCAVGDISTKKSVYRRVEMGEWGNKSAAVAGKPYWLQRLVATSGTQDIC